MSTYCVVNAAKEAIRDMPPRNEPDLDPVTLHNVEITNLDEDVESSFDKLRFLITLNPSPPETLHNILIFYLKHQFYDITADLFAQFSEVVNDLLEPVLFMILLSHSHSIHLIVCEKIHRDCGYMASCSR